MTHLRILLNGLYKQNPVFVLLLGMCPALAITASVQNAAGMGVATALVLLASTTAASSLKSLIPPKIRTITYLLIIAALTSVADMLLRTYFPGLSEGLGIFVPLIAVNCIILNRAEGFASENGTVKTVLDGLGMGAGFTLALILVAAVREILGSGSLAGLPLFGGNAQPAAMFLLPPGALLTLGLLLALLNMLNNRRNKDV